MTEPTTQSAAVRLLPVEPTAEMIWAYDDCPYEGAEDKWAAMLARAPIAPATGVVEEAVAAERERCAKVAEATRPEPETCGLDVLYGYERARFDIAVAIRGTDAKGEGA